ncbi:MAG: ABC transporter ATP-binding protein [Synergistaceae bacterium]|nr:ABC transporter ATP-binding protein [Synergistaceae bacterium]
MGEQDFIVEMRGITKRFPGVTANDNVSIQIRKGEIYAILGENGAGKSTLMSMLFGMIEPDEGEIFIRGKRERIDSPRRATQLNIGMVHQHFRLVSKYTIAENIILGIEPKRRWGVFPVVDIKRAEAEVAALSERYGLKVNPSDVIEDLNVATRQRVEILKMLYREAEILIFDEPTAVLTPQEIAAFLDIARGLRDQGKTVLLITHKLEEIKQVADRCAILNRGKLISVLDVASSSTSDMARMMVGREVSFTTPKGPARFGPPVLRLENLTVRNAAGYNAVDSVSFEIHAGEVLGIAGVSGNGQNELAEAIAGLRSSHDGKIFLNGKDITNFSIRERIEAGIAYIPEDRHNVGLILDFTLRDSLLLKQYYRARFVRHHIMDEVAFDEYRQELIDRYDIRANLGKDTLTRALSGGNQQKAIIARELNLKTPTPVPFRTVVFMQPTRGLDAGAVSNIHRQIIAERDSGAAVLLISLDLDEIRDCSDTIAVIFEGRINKIAPANSLTVEEIGLYMMGVKGGQAA